MGISFTDLVAFLANLVAITTAGLGLWRYIDQKLRKNYPTHMVSLPTPPPVYQPAPPPAYVVVPPKPQPQRSMRTWWIFGISLVVLVVLVGTGGHASTAAWVLSISLAVLVVSARVTWLVIFGNNALPTITSLQTGHNVAGSGRAVQLLQPTDAFHTNDVLYFVFTASNNGNSSAQGFVGLYTTNGQQIAAPSTALFFLSHSGMANYMGRINLSLASIQPGNYILEVRGSRHDLVPTGTPDATVTVRVIS